ncbi:DNA translocase FtsK 1-like [Diprion similis]|uniref:DNA translocase FtsK 1-like n=1 Tax=Diprion similis TaxID=362088 RepID=UPI001EF91AF5|nr:DNA translocase FtsK 1-like [Diprion similis]
MLKKIVLVFAALALAKAQIPNLGWCPDQVPMAGFNLPKFLGVWYEAERYFQLTELVSRCVVSNYTKGFDGKVRVSNEVTNRLTGIKRVLEGEVKPSPTKAEEGRINVKYTTVPLTPETQYTVLETDYENYALLWNCQSIGLAHTQSAWVMTRNRNPSSATMQMAYGALDKHGLSRRFFVKTDQAECAFDLAPTPAAAAPAPVAAPIPAVAPAAAPIPAVAPAAPATPIKEETVVPEPGLEKGVLLRSSGLLQEAEPAMEMPKEEIAVESSPAAEKLAEEVQPASVEPAKEASPKPVAPETVPEVILKVAETAKPAADPQPEAAPIAEESKVHEVVVSAEPEKVKLDVVAEPQSEAVLKDAEPAETVKPEEPVALEEPKEKPAAMIPVLNLAEPVPEATAIKQEKIETPVAAVPLQEAAALPPKSALPEPAKKEKLAEVPMAAPEAAEKPAPLEEAVKPELPAAESAVPETPLAPQIQVKNPEVAVEEPKPKVVAEPAKIVEPKP